ncbi:UPF0001 protein [Lentibacillus sp. JNUCC-1]|nr:UPF0001 protein [Lentibacillus sp. JNUCC-1]
MLSVAHNLNNIQQKISQACQTGGRDPEDVTVIGVTKYASTERTIEAVEAGITNIGENRLEGLTEKYNAIEHEVNWHFIGNLQSRKARDVVGKVAAIHSLDRRSLAKEINKRADKPVDCFVQVNVSGESTKQGLPPEETSHFIEQLADYEKIRVVGLMTMAPHIKDEDLLRQYFRTLAELKVQIENEQWDHAPCHYLSMGMSNDYEIAIEEGATHIRIGTELVGPPENNESR